MKISGGLSRLAMFAVVTLCVPVKMLSQNQARIYGFVTVVTGLAVTDGVVKLSTDRSASSLAQMKFQYTFKVDATGGYEGTGIVPGEYAAIVMSGDKFLDSADLTLKDGDDNEVDFDMTRPAYLATLSASDKATVDDYKKKYAAQLSNDKERELRLLLVQAQAYAKGGKYSREIEAMLHATAVNPNDPLLWIGLGDGWMGQADSIAASVRNMDPGIASDASAIYETGYQSAADAYDKAVTIATKHAKASATDKTDFYKQASPQFHSVIQTAGMNEAIALGKEGKLIDSESNFELLSKFEPSVAGSAYFNEAAILFNAYIEKNKDTPPSDEILKKVEQAIAAQPEQANLYFMKARLLSDGSKTAKGRRGVPAGLVDACNKYLELAPTGAQVDAVKEILANAESPDRGKGR